MNQTILITGCSSGFDKGAVKRFHDAGWNVIATMRSPEKEHELRADERLLLLGLDVTEPDSITAAFAAGRERFGRIDAVVNNAGLGGDGIFEQFTDADARALFEANVFGLMNVMHEALPAMRAAGGGVIVNVASMAGRLPVPGSAVYTASTFAVIGLTEAVALEYRPFGIRICEVSPGAYPTTGFNANASQRRARGDTQLVSFAQDQRAHFQGTIARLASEGGPAPDPREVVERIYACVASEGAPINNPTGRDAEMFVSMMRELDRQTFLDRIGAMAVPQGGHDHVE